MILINPMDLLLRCKYALGFVLVLMLAIYANALALKPDREYQALPSDYGMIYEKVGIETADGYRLEGWFFPAQDTSGISNRIVGHLPVPNPYKAEPREYRTLDDTRRATVIICGGDGANMSYLILYAYHLFTRGFNVLAFDWRGFGGSDDFEMDPDRLAYTEFLTDYDAAIDYVKTRNEVDSNRIGVFGFSTGAYLSFAAAAKNKCIAAFAGRALITSFDNVLPILRELKPDRDLKPPANYPVELEPINAAEKLNIPVFLIVGENDDRTPPRMSNRIMAKLKSSREIWIVKDATHGGGDGPEYKNYPEFFVRLAEFFKNYLK